MEAYLQSTLVANSVQQNTNRNNNNAQPNKIRFHYPLSNTEFHCSEFQTEDGTYTLLYETYADTIAPIYTNGTKATVVSLKDGLYSLKADSFEDEGFGSTLAMTSTKSAALPIPNKQTKSTLRMTTASSAGNGLRQTLTSPQKILTTTASGNNSSPYFPFSPSHPSTPTQLQQQQFASGSYMMNSPQDYGQQQSEYGFPSSYNNNPTSSNIAGSVSSISSLFNRTNIMTPSISKTTSQLSSSLARSMSNSMASNSSSNNKPKNYLAKTTSAFVRRFLVHENLQKILASGSLDKNFVFFNMGYSFFWMDAENGVKEPLSRIVFSQSSPTCHDINKTTQSEDLINIIIGFSTGDIVWYEPLSCKYARLNKGGAMVSSPVSMIKWIPGSEDLFVAIFKNGTVMVMDKDRDDQGFTPPTPSNWVESEFLSFKPHKSSKYNPVSFWKISEKALTDLCFSPDNQHMAITGEDGKMRIIDYKNERLTDVFSSYFGKLTCVDWNHDGNYILTGGEDDLVTLWSYNEKRMIARCEGHKSWVTSVCFDRFFKPDDQTIRFGSVGEDCNLCFWEFSYTVLIKPKHPRVITSPKLVEPSTQCPPTLPYLPVNIERKKSSRTNRLFRPFSSTETASVSTPSTSNSSFGRFRKRSSQSSQDFQYEIAEEQMKQYLPVIHATLKKSQAALLEPVAIQEVHPDPCVSLAFKETMLVTSDRRGRIFIWSRPNP